MRTISWRVLCVAWMLAIACSVAPAAVYYVTPTGNGLKNGSTWANAFDDVQAAVNSCAMAVPGLFREPDQIWVAGGTFTPRSTAGARKSAIYLAGGRNAEIYGGFAGTESALEQRSPALHPTIINGSLANAGQPALHVVQMLGILPTEGRQMIDGLIITGGRADLGYNDPPSVDNNGGGLLLYPYHSGRKVLLRNCVIAGNVARWSGGGLWSQIALEAANCVFAGNCVGAGAAWDVSIPAGITVGGGGASVGDLVRANFRHCSFVGNYHPSRASALLNYTGALMGVYSCLFDGNRIYQSSSDRAAALVAESTITMGSFSLHNCLFDENHNASSSAADLYYGLSRLCYSGGSGINSLGSLSGEDVVANLGGTELERPAYAEAFSGAWSANGVYSASEGVTQAVCSAVLPATVRAGALIEVAAGAPFGSRLAVVTAASGNEVWLAGNWSSSAPLPRVQSGAGFCVRDFHPTASSAAVDHGENSGAPILFSSEPVGAVYGTGKDVQLGAQLMLNATYAITYPGITDLDEQPRRKDGDLDGTIVADIGAYEFQTGQGASPLIRWQKDGLVLSDNTRVSGTSTSTLTIQNLTPDDAGNYTCVVTYGQSSVQSQPALLQYAQDNNGIEDWEQR